MSRAARLTLAAVTGASAGTGVGGYVAVMLTTSAHTAWTGFLFCVVGLGVFLCCMHAWTDLS